MKKKDRSKHNVSKDKTRRTYNNIVFDSELEMRYYIDVILTGVENGTIINYELQKKYELQPKFRYNGKIIKEINYIADFYIEYSDGNIEVIDTKGFADDIAKLKRKLFYYLYPDIKYRWISYSKIDGGWIDYDILQKNRRLRKLNKANER